MFSIQRAAFALIRNNEGKILTILAPDPARGWELPGGMVEKNESFLEGLAREVLEETGTTIKEIELYGIYENLSVGRTVLGFLASHDGGSLKIGCESLDLGWFAETNVMDLLGREMVKDRLQDGLSYKGRIVRRTYRTEPYRTESFEELAPNQSLEVTQLAGARSAPQL